MKHRKLIGWFIPPTDIGANASAEEADEGLEDSSKSVIDVVDGFRLNFLGDEASGTRAFKTKKDYLTQLKGRFAEQSSPTPRTALVLPPNLNQSANLHRRRAGFLKKVVEKLKEQGADEEKVKAFQTGAQNYYTKHIAPNFKDFDFYTGESMDPDGMYARPLPPRKNLVHMYTHVYHFPL